VADHQRVCRRQNGGDVGRNVVAVELDERGRDGSSQGERPCREPVMRDPQALPSRVIVEMDEATVGHHKEVVELVL